MDEDDDEDQDEEVDIEYDGIEGMEQQIEDEEGQMHGVDGEMMGDEDDHGEEEIMGEGEDEDDFVEINEDQLAELIMQQQNQMAIQGDDDDEQLE